MFYEVLSYKKKDINSKISVAVLRYFLTTCVSLLATYY